MTHYPAGVLDLLVQAAKFGDRCSASGRPGLCAGVAAFPHRDGQATLSVKGEGCNCLYDGHYKPANANPEATNGQAVVFDLYRHGLRS